MPDQPETDPIPPVPDAMKPGACPFSRFLRTRRSWLDHVSARSYGMLMGEVRLPFTRLFMPNEPGLVRRVLVEDRATFPKDRRYWSLLDPLMGRSVLNSDGAEWERHRRMIDPAFEQARLKVVFPHMVDATAAMLARVRAAAASGGRFAVDAETTHVTADIILRALLSRRMDEADARRLYADFTIFTEALPRQTSFAIGRVPGWLRWMMPFSRGRRAATAIRARLEAWVRPRFDGHRAGQESGDDDILAGLLAATDPADGSRFTFSEVVDHLAMLFLAGHETSATALAWAIHLIATHAEIQEGMAAEVAAEAGTAPIGLAETKRLKLVMAVFRETLRLYPPVGFLPREAAVAAAMRDKPIAAGCPVMVSPWLVHRHRRIWDRPDHFDPGRFLPGGEAEGKTGAYLPFGMGPRVCMGQAFALQEAVLILGELVRAFRFTPEPGHRPYPVGRLTIRTRDPLLVRVAPRTAQSP
ncbi:MAG: hypothetical protein RLZZ127_891 [Planctomycetota bacterium]|jgi:cytochrome P450